MTREKIAEKLVAALTAAKFQVRHNEAMDWEIEDDEIEFLDGDFKHIHIQVGDGYCSFGGWLKEGSMLHGPDIKAANIADAAMMKEQVFAFAKRIEDRNAND